MEEKGTISIHTENIFPIIKKFLYSDHEIFLRELVSNAVDATQKINRLAALGEYQGEVGETTIKVSFDKEAKTITISDRGIGMTADEIKKYINQIAFSGATEFVEKYKEAEDANQIIGHFGLGFYSAFMVAGTVEINTLSYQEGASPARWICDGSQEFTISEGDRSERGTDIILHVNEDSEEFLDDARIKGILDKYGKFLPVTIEFGTTTRNEPDGEDEEGQPKYKSVEEPRIINNTAPIWTKSPNDLKDEDYLNFYKELYPFQEDPLFWIHLNVDYPFNLTGILYFPKVKDNFEPSRNKIQLYSRQVFITDEVKDVVPEFLMLLHGVIDSPDIPLNVSRSFLQADSNVKKINNYITKKVADKLNDLFKNDREGFEAKWDSIGLFVKYGMISDEKFYDKAQKFALLQNTEGTLKTFEEYKELVAANQTDKSENLIWLYTNDKDAQHTYVSSAQKRSYDVLDLGGPLDSHFINHIETKLEKTQIKRVDAELMDKIIDKDEKREAVLSEDEQTKLKDIYTEAIGEDQMTLEIEALSPDEAPVTITEAEFMRRMKDMAAVSGGGMPFMGGMGGQQTVTINANHSLASKILNSRKPEKKQALARQAYDLALLSQGLLKGEALANFINRSVELAAG